uniref:Dolichol-phosphate mannosyltransferase subunit 3 n=1 Tax=Strongyloides papillosus TaxID=174720 RepID=A0A0N5CAZ9_STREA
MATQLALFASIILPLFISWLGLYNQWIPEINRRLPVFFINSLGYIPFVVVGGLGMYALFSVAYGVATFNDCKEAQKELMDQVAEAKKELKKRKIIS